MEKEFSEDEAKRPKVYGFCVFAGAEEEFWGAVPIVKRGEEIYQTVTTWGVMGLSVISLAMPKSAASAIARGVTNL